MGTKKNDFIVKAIGFWKRNKKKILIIFIIWVIVIIINNIIKNRPKEIENPRTTYTPETTVMNENITVPKEKHNTISEIIEKFITFCNNKQYEEAYNMISEDSKASDYTSLEVFKKYVDYIFGDKKKIYNIQSYSVVNNKYIYNVRIMDDILANGTSEPFLYNGEYYDGYYYYEEKFVLTEENGEMKLSIGEKIENSKKDIIVEDDYIVARITDKSTDYESETYTIQIDNKTNNYIVISDGAQNNEVVMNYDGLELTPENQYASIVIRPNSFVVRELKFGKYYDDGRNATALKFGAVRVLKKYDFNKKTTEEDLKDAVKLYAFEIGF